MSTENIKKIVESARNRKPVDAQNAFNTEIMERITAVLPDYMKSLNENAFGPRDEDDEDDFTDDDFDELSDEDFADLLDNLSDEELEDLADQIDGLDESELQELSKKTLGSYIKKAHADSGAREERVGYKQGTEQASGGIKGLSVSKSLRKIKNHEKGISKAVDKLTKEEVSEGVKEIHGFDAKKNDSTGKFDWNVHRYSEGKKITHATGTADDHKTAYAKAKSVHAKMVKSLGESEQIDEISTAKKADYAAKAVMHVSDIRDRAKARVARHGLGSGSEKEAGEIKKANQRSKILKKLIGKRDV